MSNFLRRYSRWWCRILLTNPINTYCSTYFGSLLSVDSSSRTTNIQAFRQVHFSLSPGNVQFVAIFTVQRLGGRALFKLLYPNGAIQWTKSFVYFKKNSQKIQVDLIISNTASSGRMRSISKTCIVKGIFYLIFSWIISKLYILKS